MAIAPRVGFEVWPVMNVFNSIGNTLSPNSVCVASHGGDGGSR